MRDWWQRGVIYQIYPRSYQDSSGDGVGDLQGILRRLDQVASLGVDAVWLSPIFPSPMADFGYDVADYTDVDPLFGDLADLDELVAACHQRGLKLLLDLVPNHSSDRHPWFQEALEGPGSRRRDWYHWRDPAPDGGPPNNWLAYFGGPAWTLDEASGQYYLHQFLPQQPELNYRNPAVREAMHEVLRFWLRRGVDGFRVDVIHLMSKHPDYPDDPPDPDHRPGIDPPDRQFRHVNRQDRPEVHEIIRGFRRVLDEFDDRVMIGEIYLPAQRLASYYGADLDECHLPFNFDLILLEQWTPASVRESVESHLAAVPEGGWPNFVLGNHDQPRVATRRGPARARLNQMLLLTLKGTPTVYYGEELGLEDVEVPRERWQDPSGLRQPDLPGASRDPCRTPMPWSPGPGAGFCPPEVEPWLPFGPERDRVNWEVQEGRPDSPLALFRTLTRLRRGSEALVGGELEFLDVDSEQALVFVRRAPGEALVVALNFGATPLSLDLSALGQEGRVLVSTRLDREGQEALGSLALHPHEGVVAAVSGAGGG